MNCGCAIKWVCEEYRSLRFTNAETCDGTLPVSEFLAKFLNAAALHLERLYNNNIL